jgi:hypothetical protein
MGHGLHFVFVCNKTSRNTQRHNKKRGCGMNAAEMAETKNLLIWMALWIGALMVLLPALAGS